MPNHLANETSPYLLQHVENPVDWYPWGEEAIQRAQAEDKPIFLSIGYSACHWCHVMAHESFESDAIAAILNEHFVSIKVDREERPDLDQIYMNAVQMLTGRGGWPMSVFLTPELKPFYGGTYWPATAARGMPGFDEVLAAIVDAWQNRRQQAEAGAEHLAGELQKVASGVSDGGNELSLDLIQAAVAQLRQAFDATNGGFGAAPKFPHPMALELLLSEYQRTGQGNALKMVRTTLDRMAGGGIYDHLGGGFARYSVDPRWLVPHFEKMLYDNALLAGVYVDAYLVTHDEAYARTVRETLDYVLRDMTDPKGGFYSTEDADSEGEEGLFYTWTPDEVRAVLGDEAAAVFGRVYDVTDDGNFEGRNILHLGRSIEQSARLMEREPAELAAELAQSREKLFAAREKRVRPGRDDKVLVGWNGLAIDAMARAGSALDEPRYIEAASRAADFILNEMRREDGRLLHTWRAGTAKLDAYLDDYTSLALSLVSLYEATFDQRWITAAADLMDMVLDHFVDPNAGAFFYTATDHEALITRTKELSDGSTPGGNAQAATVLLRLGTLLGRSDYHEAADQTIRLAVPIIERAPMAAGQMLLALDRQLGPAHELVFVGDMNSGEAEAALRSIRGHFLPRSVLAGRDSSTTYDNSPLELLFAGKEISDNQPTLYVCQDFACTEPAVGHAAIEAKLDELCSS